MIRAISGDDSGTFIIQDHKQDDRDRSDIQGKQSLVDGILTKGRPDGSFFNDVDRGRKCAGPQDDGQVPGLFHAEAAFDNGASAADFGPDVGGGINGIVQNDGKPFVDIFTGYSFKDAASFFAEGHGNIRLIVL